MYGTGMKNVNKFWKFPKVPQGLIGSKTQDLGVYTVINLISRSILTHGCNVNPRELVKQSVSENWYSHVEIYLMTGSIPSQRLTDPLCQDQFSHANWLTESNLMSQDYEIKTDYEVLNCNL